MKPIVRIGLVFGLIYMIIRIVFFQAQLDQNELGKMLTFCNLLLVMLAIFFAVRTSHKAQKAEERTFIADFKAGMQAAGVYIVVFSCFYMLYYKVIDTDFLSGQVAKRVHNDLELINHEIAGGKKVFIYDDGAVKLENSLLSEISTPRDTIDFYYERYQKNLTFHQSYNSITFDISVSVLGLLILSLFYSVCISVLIRRFSGKLTV